MSRLASLLFVALLVGGCGRGIFNDSHSHTTIGSAPYVEGSGRTVSETRALETYSAISVENGLTVEVMTGDKSSATVTADDNLVGMIVTTVANGTLTVSVRGSLTTDNPLRVTLVTATTVDSLQQSNGSTVEFESISADRLQVSVSAGSTLRAGGRATSLDVAAAAGSTVDLRNVEAKTAEVRVDAGSTVHLKASDSVSGYCTTGSRLFVRGGASIDGVQVDIASTVTRE